MKIYIYTIYFPTSDKYYIGKTINLKVRMLNHLKGGYLIGNALRKYDDWQIEILHVTQNENQANLLEIKNIHNFNSVKPNGYNQTKGGDGSLGYKPTNEAREKIRQKAIGRKYPGRKRSLEFCKNAREKQLGKKCPAVSKSNKRRIGEKRTGNALINLRIGQLKYQLKRLEK